MPAIDTEAGLVHGSADGGGGGAGGAGAAQPLPAALLRRPPLPAPLAPHPRLLPALHLLRQPVRSRRAPPRLFCLRPVLLNVVRASPRLSESTLPECR